MIVSVEVQTVEPLADGAAFAAVGAYDKVIGVARGEVDPGAPGNKGIALIEQGMAKGGLKRPEDAKLHLGMAQQQSAKSKARARQRVAASSPSSASCSTIFQNTTSVDFSPLLTWAPRSCHWR